MRSGCYIEATATKRKGGNRVSSISVKISWIKIFRLTSTSFGNCNFLNFKFFTTMVGYICKSKRKFNKSYGETWSPNNCMQSLSVFHCFLMTKKGILYLKFLFAFNPWLLNSFDEPSYRLELSERYSLRLFLSRGEEFSEVVLPWGIMIHLGERCAWGGLVAGGNYDGFCYELFS